MTRPSTDPNHDRVSLDFEKSPEVLRTVGDQLGLGVFTVDEQGRFVGWSGGAVRITGYSLEDVRGQPCHMLDGPNCKGFSGLADLLSAPTPDSFGMDNQECRVYSRDSRELHLLGSVRLLRDDAGKVYGAVGSFTDLTEILKLNAPALSAPSGQGLVGLIGQSAAMIEVFRRVQLAADSDVTTLITGDSGTGKELAARAIHALSRRNKKPFVAINCAAIPESLLESELFGHVKGAFTGAVRDRAGVFESANGGTLFLDEIGDVSPLLQTKLLRVLQEREIQRVGDDKAHAVDVRLLTATNRDLPKRIEEKLIREDFYYRIRVFDIRMPALRERSDDIPLLAQRFVDELSRAQGKSVSGIARDALEALIRHTWPGNVRELYNAIEHAMVIQKGDTVGLLDLPEDVRNASEKRVVPLGKRSLTPEQESERIGILEALEEHGWNRTRSAKSLGVSRVTLWKKIRRYQLDEGLEQSAEHSESAPPPEH
ncbi:MAG: two-component system response regulator HydG [Chlamydiales bacterium]|jgi:two-component system response regulator HydG